MHYTFFNTLLFTTCFISFCFYYWVNNYNSKRRRRRRRKWLCMCVSAPEFGMVESSGIYNCLRWTGWKIAIECMHKRWCEWHTLSWKIRKECWSIQKWKCVALCFASLMCHHQQTIKQLKWYNNECGGSRWFTSIQSNQTVQSTINLSVVATVPHFKSGVGKTKHKNK